MKSAVIYIFVVIFLLFPCNLFGQEDQKWSFKEVPRHLGNDIKESVWGWQALILAGGAATAAVFYTQDDEINGWVSNNRPLEDVDGFFNHFGAYYTLGGISVVTWGAGEVFEAPKLALTGECMVEALFLSQAVSWIMKVSFWRERPDQSNSFSFPSGHASGSFAIATVLEFMHGPLLGVPAYALAGLVSFSRMEMGKHWFSDIVFGAALGTALGYGTVKFHKKENPDLFLTPLVSQRGYGINLTYLF